MRARYGGPPDAGEAHIKNHITAPAMHTVTLLDNFPSRFTPRRIQREILGDIESAIKSEYRNILLCVPTGVGKSHVGITVAKSLGSSFIVTAQKILQDQYTRDFGFVYPMKGMSNFPCLDLYRPLGLSYRQAALDPKLGCNSGVCSWEEKTEDGEKKTKFCKYKPSPTMFMVSDQGTEQEKIAEPMKQTCYYYNQKFKALLATHALFNYASYFQTRLYSKGMEEYLERDFLVADEAHEIEEQIIGYIGIDVIPSYMSDTKLNFEAFVTDSIDGVLEMLDSLGDGYTGIIRKMESDDPRTDQTLRLRKRRDSIDLSAMEIRDDPDNFVVQEYRGADGDIAKVSIKPIEVGKYTKQFFDLPRQLFMSATINKERFCKTMDIPESECAFVEVPLSPFPVENRRIKFHNVRWLNYRSTPQDYEAVYRKAGDILRQYGDKKGLILTTTRQQCSDILNVARSRIAVAHEGVEGRREAVLEGHSRTSRPSVLASPSFWYGVDLKDDLSRFQIIVKTPYLSMADKRTRVKAKRDGEWYRYASMVKLLQGFGRSVRGQDDYCDTHVLDGAAQSLLVRMKKYVPKAYHDSLGW